MRSGSALRFCEAAFVSRLLGFCKIARRWRGRLRYVRRALRVNRKTQSTPTQYADEIHRRNCASWAQIDEEKREAYAASIAKREEEK